MADNSKAICDLNDKFRQQIPGPSQVPGRVMLTSGIQQLTEDEAEPGKHIAALFQQVREFNAFSEDNDPYHEHDFGAFDFLGEKVFWKIDQYAPDMLHGSEDPSDITKTVRVLTIMLASEY